VFCGAWFWRRDILEYSFTLGIFRAAKTYAGDYGFSFPDDEKGVMNGVEGICISSLVRLEDKI
jgi:hypothetical protein